jgi:hypothetical protein
LKHKGKKEYKVSQRGVCILSFVVKSLYICWLKVKYFMKKILFLLFLLISSSAQAQSPIAVRDSTMEYISKGEAEKMGVSTNFVFDSTQRYADTTIAFEVSEVGAEGCGVDAHYLDGLLSTLKIVVFGCSGRSECLIVFWDNEKIVVVEKCYKYRGSIGNIKSDEDMVLDFTLCYKLDSNGRVIGGVLGGDRENSLREIYREIMGLIPKEIKDIK